MKKGNLRVLLKNSLINKSLEIENQWNEEGILKICPGKELLMKITKWLRDEFEIYVSDDDFIENMSAVDIDIYSLVEKIRRVYPDLGLIPVSEKISLRLIPSTPIGLNNNEISIG